MGSLRSRRLPARLRRKHRGNFSLAESGIGIYFPILGA
jgi:hypothetical protein